MTASLAPGRPDNQATARCYLLFRQMRDMLAACGVDLHRAPIKVRWSADKWIATIFTIDSDPRYEDLIDDVLKALATSSASDVPDNWGLQLVAGPDETEDLWDLSGPTPWAWSVQLLPC